MFVDFRVVVDHVREWLGQWASREVSGKEKEKNLGLDSILGAALNSLLTEFVFKNYKYDLVFHVFSVTKLALVVSHGRQLEWILWLLMTWWCREPGHQLTRYLWWHYQMKTFSALLALCEGNSPVTGEFPSQRPVTLNFDAFFDLCLTCWTNHRDAVDLRHHCAHYDVTVIWHNLYWVFHNPPVHRENNILCRFVRWDKTEPSNWNKPQRATARNSNSEIICMLFEYIQDLRKFILYLRMVCLFIFLNLFPPLWLPCYMYGCMKCLNWPALFSKLKFIIRKMNERLFIEWIKWYELTSIKYKLGMIDSYLNLWLCEYYE